MSNEEKKENTKFSHIYKGRCSNVYVGNLKNILNHLKSLPDYERIVIQPCHLSISGYDLDEEEKIGDSND